MTRVNANDIYAQELFGRIDAEGAIRPGAVYLLQGRLGSRMLLSARHLRALMPESAPFRAPHHTVSVLGAVGELALAAGGLLFLDDVLEFSNWAVQSIFRHWTAMAPRVRPVLVVAMYVELGTAAAPVTAKFLAAQYSRIENLAAVLPPVDHHVITSMG